MKRERTLLILVNLLLMLAMGLMSYSAHSQSLPFYLNPDPAYWRNLYEQEHKRAEGLEKDGQRAIQGLQASLQVANNTIAAQNKTIVAQNEDFQSMKTERDKERKRAEDCAGKQPKTWAGRQLQKIGNTGKNILAGVGAATLAGFTLKLIL